jgi:hypothetical protein
MGSSRDISDADYGVLEGYALTVYRGDVPPLGFAEWTAHHQETVCLAPADQIRNALRALDCGAGHSTPQRHPMGVLMSQIDARWRRDTRGFLERGSEHDWRLPANVGRPRLRHALIGLVKKGEVRRYGFELDNGTFELAV